MCCQESLELDMNQIGEGSILAHDVLASMAAKMDDRTLALLYAIPAYRDRLRVIVNSRDFWYERAMYLTGKRLLSRPEADWKTIYYALKNVSARDWKESRYRDALDDFDSLLTLEEVYGPVTLKWPVQDGMTGILSRVGDLRVFDYIESKYPGRYRLWEVLEGQIELQNREIVDKLLLEAKTYKPKNSQDISFPVIVTAAEGGDLKSLRYLLENLVIQVGQDDLELLLDVTLRNDQLEVYKYLIERYPGITDDQVTLTRAASVDAINIFRDVFERSRPEAGANTRLLSIATQRGSPDVFAYLTSDPTISEAGWMKLLRSAAEAGSEEIVKQILPHLPNEDLTLFPWEIGAPHPDVIALLTENFSPVPKLDEIIALIKKSPNGPALAEILVRDPRVKTQDLTRSQIVHLSVILRDTRIIMSNLPFTVPVMIKVFLRDVGSIVGNDIYSLALREMTLKHPNKLALLDWMIALVLRAPVSTELKHADLTTVASSILSETRVPARLVPLQSLMLAMLYPTLDDHEQLEQLRAAGAPQDVLFRTEALLAKYRSLL